MVVLLRLFLLLLLSNGFLCNGEYKVLNLQNHQWEKNVISSCHSHKSRSVNGAMVLEMKHTDHCSKQTITARNKKTKKRLITDNLRVRSLQTRIKTSISGTDSLPNSEIPLNSGITLDTLNYIVQVGIGGRNLTVIVDTGSDLTWVQCQPCTSCYSQQQPLLNTSTSQSYQPILCLTAPCLTNLGICGDSDACHYDVTYGDGSYSRGDLGVDTLSLGASRLDDFVFGCGRDSRGLFGGASGLMGLGISNVSVISQTFDLFGGVFSYCLPPTEARDSGSLVLGGNSSGFFFKNSTPISYTKMVANPNPSSFYLLNMTGITIGGVALRVTNSVMILDSGTVISRLAPLTYNAVRDEFLRQFSGFLSVPGYSILDTCFDLGGFEEVNVPTVRMHFDGGGEMDVDVSGILYFVKSDASLVCLGVASLLSEDEIGIIGNFQQKNQRVVYDTKERRVGFAGEMCSF